MSIHQNQPAVKAKVKSGYRYPLILFSCVLAGGIIGAFVGEKATVVEPIGTLFINLLFTLIVPLVFFSISSSISMFSDMKRLGRMLGNTLGIFVFTGAIASVLMIFVVKIFHVGSGLVIETTEVVEAKSLSLGEHIVNMFTVSDFSGLLSKNNMLPLIVFSILFGLSVSMLGEKGQKVSESLTNLADVCFKMINILMKLAPIGLAAYFANLTGVYGPTLLGTYAKVMAVFYPVAILYFFLFNPLYCYYAGGLDCVKAFFKNFLPPFVTALGTRSSSACIPLQREFCDRVGVPGDVSGVVLPMGATMHMDGACLGVITKIAVACAIFNVPFEGIGMYAFSILLAVASATAVSAVPGGGAVGEALIVSVLGLPAGALPIVMMIGTLIDPIATALNSCGDAVASMMVTRRLEGRDWMQKNLSGMQNRNW